MDNKEKRRLIQEYSVGRMRCVHKDSPVEHHKKYEVQPDCETCDGMGLDAKKYGWQCYISSSEWLRKNGKKI